MIYESLAHALTDLAITCWRNSLAVPPTQLAAATLRSSLAHGLKEAPAAQLLRSRPAAARLCRRGAACDGERLHGPWMDV